MPNEYDRKRYERLREDPEWVKERNARNRAYYARKRKDPKWRERNRAYQTEYARERRKDPRVQEKIKARNRARYGSLSEKARKHYIKRVALWKYGITVEQYDKMVEQQGGVCAICGQGPDRYARLVVDHDHETDEIRALLCHNCNLGIGHMEDDPELIKKALSYLRKHERRLKT